MRRLAQRKTRLIFETEDCIFERGQNRQIVIDARPAYCLLRLKGQRRTFGVSYAAVYHEALHRAAESERRQKLSAAQGRRKKGRA